MIGEHFDRLSQAKVLHMTFLIGEKNKFEKSEELIDREVKRKSKTPFAFCQIKRAYLPMCGKGE